MSTPCPAPLARVPPSTRTMARQRRVQFTRVLGGLFLAGLGAVAAILASDGVDAAIISAVPVTPALDNLPAAPGLHGEDLDAPGSLAGRLVPLLAGGGKPAVIVVDSGPLYDPLCARFELAGVPVFRKIDRAARALACFVAACARTAAARPLEDR